MPLSDPLRLTPFEITALLTNVSKHNFALYQIEKSSDVESSKQALKAIGCQLGLTNLDGNLCADNDGITSLAVSSRQDRGGYIPYSNKAISWHTDGYYNSPTKTIRAVILQNVTAAATGGANQIMDHEMLYILLRDINPAYIKCLMQNDVMTIPANNNIRAAQSGPVFSLHQHQLHMRYSARKRNILWKKDTVVQEAVACITELLGQSHEAQHKIKLSSGQGIVCNNILHTRDAFMDDDKHQRLMLRARYYERIKK